jgi:hypothetical protein
MTAQIPASFTQGTSTTNMSDVFAGDWRQLIIGAASRLHGADPGGAVCGAWPNRGIAHWHGDIGLTRARAFAVYRYLKSN